MSLLLERGSSSEKVDVAACAAQLRMEPLRPLLRRLLEDADSSVVRSAISALGSMGDRESIPAVLALLESRVPDYQEEVIACLSEFGDGPWIPGVVRYLQNRRVEVRESAARILCWVGRREGVPELLSTADRTLSSSLLALNGIRRREVWKGLATTTRLRVAGLRPLDDIASVAKEAGLRLELELTAEQEDLLTREGEVAEPVHEERLSQARSLERALRGLPFEAVIESGCIRIRSRARAMVFWKGEFSK